MSTGTQRQVLETVLTSQFDFSLSCSFPIAAVNSLPEAISLSCPAGPEGLPGRALLRDVFCLRASSTDQTTHKSILRNRFSYQSDTDSHHVA